MRLIKDQKYRRAFCLSYIFYWLLKTKLEQNEIIYVWIHKISRRLELNRSSRHQSHEYFKEEEEEEEGIEEKREWSKRMVPEEEVAISARRWYRIGENREIQKIDLQKIRRVSGAAVGGSLLGHLARAAGREVSDTRRREDSPGMRHRMGTGACTARAHRRRLACAARAGD